MAEDSDPFGQSLWDFHRNGSSWHVIERDDGMIEPFNASLYFTTPRQWAPQARQALRLVHGRRVVDIGCGAGRHALYLQQRGFEVLGIDASPLAIRTARARGLKRAKVVPIENVSPRLGKFDTLILFGNNFGLFGNPRKARRLLRRFRDITAPDARILAESNNVYETDNPIHLAYHQRNRRRGRMAGQIRLRVRYKNLASAYFDYLMVSPDEMRQIVEGTGWRIARILPSSRSGYIAMLTEANS